MNIKDTEVCLFEAIKVCHCECLSSNINLLLVLRFNMELSPGVQQSFQIARSFTENTYVYSNRVLTFSRARSLFLYMVLTYM